MDVEKIRGIQKLLEVGLDYLEDVPDTQTSLRYDCFCKFDAALRLCKKALLDEQPPAGSEFTKKCKDLRMNPQKFGKLTWREVLFEACDHLERLEAEKKELRQGIINDRDGNVVLVPTELFNGLESRFAKRGEAIKAVLEQRGLYHFLSGIVKRILGGEEFERIMK